MNKSNTGKSWIHSGIVFAQLVAIIFFTTACGGGSVGGGSTGAAPRVCGSSSHTTPAQPTISTIAATDAAIVATPYLAGNSIQYFCDCQAGASGGCVAGNDATGAGTQGSPYQTIGAAMTWLNGGAHRTAALCQGGSFTLPPSTGQFGLVLASNSSCTSGICNELREYPFGGIGAKPIIINLAGSQDLFSTNNGGGGYRFMNLKLQGTHNLSNGNVGFFIYANAATGKPPVHDIAIENVDMDGFDLGINDAVNSNNNITIIGNHFTNISNFGYLGSSFNLTLSYNSFVDTGSDNKFDHAIYLGSHEPVSNVSIVGNFIKGFSTVSGNTKCMGAPFIGHAAVTNLTVSGNVVVEDTNADPGCYGMGFNNTTGATGGIFYRNALFSGNVVVNGGNNGINISSCPSCAIENNLIISQSNSGGAAISTPAGSARPQDDVECYAKIVNNTAYYETTSKQGMNGFVVGGEGTGHIVANNTVMYAGTSHTLNRTNCFTYNLPLASYDFINNNNCFSNDPVSYWAYGSTTYSLAAWQTYSAKAGIAGTGFDTASLFANPGWSFSAPLAIPALDESKTGAQLFAPYFTPVGSPLKGAANAANAPGNDIANIARSLVTPSVGAYE